MTSDLDTYRTANLVIEQYGADGAGMHAAMRADELLEASDMDGRQVLGIRSFCPRSRWCHHQDQEVRDRYDVSLSQ